jgi:bifunctional DNA-binding transcriptional regulator/antitoxin component of YhaV-PrlF toxin-antitoxin module
LGSFKSVFVPLAIVGNMEHVTVKVDSKGRICIPAEIREEIGDVATIKKTKEGYLIVPGKREDFLEEFQKLISSQPRRKGKPKLASPEEMKSTWRTVK